MKEYAFMVALGEHGLPVPYAVAHNRHCVLMTMVDAVPLVQVRVPLQSVDTLLGNSPVGSVHYMLLRMTDCLQGIALLIVLPPAVSEKSTYSAR